MIVALLVFVAAVNIGAILWRRHTITTVLAVNAVTHEVVEVEGTPGALDAWFDMNPEWIREPM